MDQKHVSMVLSFIYNFLVEQQFMESLGVFEKEYMKKYGEDLDNLRKSEPTDNIFIQNELLRDDFQKTEKITEEVKNSLESANKRIMKLRKERDFYIMHHKRVLQEKETLNKEISKQKKENAKIEALLSEMRNKYENAVKERMLVVLEKEKRDSKIDGLNKYIERLKELLGYDEPYSSTEAKNLKTGESGSSVHLGIISKDKKKIEMKPDTPWPYNDNEEFDTNDMFDRTKREDAETLLDEEFEESSLCISTLSIKYSIKAHNYAIPGLAYNNKVHLLGTGGDDGIWKTWSNNEYELVMSSQAHKNWIGDIHFNKNGNILCTCGGDNKIKLWDLIKEKCVHTFTNNTGPVWSLTFHHEGNFFASSSMDQTVRIFDMNSLKQRQILRGHVDSVNCVHFHPFSNTLVTASADRTLSIWDMRSGLCENTFYGHHFPCNFVDFNKQATLIFSCDSGGVVKLWDIRSNKTLLNLDTGPASANKCPLDKSDQCLFVASEDHTIKIFNVNEKRFVRSLKHEAPVKNVIIENDKVISSLGNGEIKIWSSENI